MQELHVRGKFGLLRDAVRRGLREGARDPHREQHRAG